MKGSDELDRTLAAAYAWGQMPAGDAADAGSGRAASAEGASTGEGAAEDAAEDAPASEDAPPSDDPTFDVLRERAGRVCAAIAEGVERAWSLPVEEQAPLVAKLILQAEELGIGFSAMQDHPRESVRLLRLAVRCGERLSPEVREAMRGAALWSDASHPEVIDLLVEVAEAEDQELGDALALALHTLDSGEIGRMHGATARFAKLLDSSTSFVTRRMATDWLRLGATREAVPALRRALRAPHFGLRHRAFDLLERRFPDAIEAGDVLFLLEEAVVHPPPEEIATEEISRALTYFPERLTSAVARLRPPGGAELLLRVVDLRCARQYRFEGFNQAWAMEAIATAYPEAALPAIDVRMRHVEHDRRMLAAIGAGKLPDDLAWPRLLALAADGVPEVAERAREKWLERRGELCPVDALAGVEAWLFEAPPDERTTSRLALLRRAPVEARAAMVEVLLGEAPDPAALALLLFAGTDGGVWERHPRPGLPTSRREYVEALVQRFGAPAVRGVCALAKRFPEGRWSFLDALGELAMQGSIPEDARSLVIEAAMDALARGAPPRYAVLAIFAKLGTPDELFDRLWAMTQDPEVEGYLRRTAAEALAKIQGADARLAEAVQRAIADAGDDPGALDRAIAAGLPAKIVSALDRAERVVAELGDARPASWTVVSLVGRCMDALAANERAPTSWQDDALAKPGTSLFCVAAKRARDADDPAIAAALRAGVAHEDPISASAAALTMLWLGLIEPDGSELPPILERAPLDQRASLIGFVLYSRVPPMPFWPWIEEVLLTTDRSLTREIERFALASAPADLTAALIALLPRIPLAEVRAFLEQRLDRALLAGYWQDDRDDEDDGEEDEEDGPDETG